MTDTNVRTDRWTPGPWSVKERGGQTIRVDIVSDAESLPFTPSFVAGDILPADARIIAAAPVMLAVLDSIEACLSAGDMDALANARTDAQALLARLNQEANG